MLSLNVAGVDFLTSHQLDIPPSTHTTILLQSHLASMLIASFDGLNHGYLNPVNNNNTIDVPLMQ
jgi:hypothetical protein